MAKDLDTIIQRLEFKVNILKKGLDWKEANQLLLDLRDLKK